MEWRGLPDSAVLNTVSPVSPEGNTEGPGTASFENPRCYPREKPACEGLLGDA